MGRYSIELLKTEQLAKMCGYTSASPAFRLWCASLGITPVTGRRDVYDPILVRQRLDEAQGLLPKNPDVVVARRELDENSLSLVEQRRLRKALQKDDD